MDQITPRRSDPDDARPDAEEHNDDREVSRAAPPPAEARGPRPDEPKPADGRPAAHEGDGHDVMTLSAGEGGTGDGRSGADRPAMPSRWIFAGVALVLGLALAWGVYTHWKTSSAADETQQKRASLVPGVRVAKAQSEDGPVGLTLPGETQPFATANIYARATGYITERRVDIGSRVKKGDLLVHISAPDLDQQLEQAQAQLGQVQAAAVQAQATVNQSDANLNLAKVNLQRAQALVGQGYETLQNRDQLQANQIAQGANVDAARAGVKVAEANVKAQQASIDRLKALTDFEDVRAPFDGVVTVRNVDLGALVNADASSGTPMFTVEEDDVLRVLVQVPQNSAIGVRDGLEARISVPQMPGRTFVGKVTRSSSSLQSSARTLTAEVDIPNEAGVLRSGLYAYVTLEIPRTSPDVVLPAETLIFDQSGTHVAVVGEGDKVKMVPVEIRRDFGTSIEVASGPKGGDRVVLSPPASLRDGAPVKVEADEKAGGEGGSGGGEGAKSSGSASSAAPGGAGGEGAKDKVSEK